MICQSLRGENPLPLSLSIDLSVSLLSLLSLTLLSLLAIDTRRPTPGHCDIDGSGLLGLIIVLSHITTPPLSPFLSLPLSLTALRPCLPLPLSDRTIPLKKKKSPHSNLHPPRLGNLFLQKEHPIPQGGNRYGHRHGPDNLQGVLWRSQCPGSRGIFVAPPPYSSYIILILCVTICGQLVPGVHWDQLICPQFTQPLGNSARILSTSNGTHRSSKNPSLHVVFTLKL
ncbi:MAG: hypothetical protein J3Q66DRAFT_326526 [Benniella sp.]|nr:MAG: hypothetical protein J3Q66DRAFT_326526 [Benniella sp.]